MPLVSCGDGTLEHVKHGRLLVQQPLDGLPIQLDVVPHERADFEARARAMSIPADVSVEVYGFDVDRAKHERAHRDALGTRFLDACGAYDDATLTCALASTDSSALRTCLGKQVSP